MWMEYNKNPDSRRGDDCTVRAIATCLDKPWEEVYTELCARGLIERDMPSANHVWAAYLRSQGYERRAVQNTCPDCYTVADFAADHRRGRYIVALHGHVVAVIDGDYYDTWDSGEEVVFYYWQKGR